MIGVSFVLWRSDPLSGPTGRLNIFEYFWFFQYFWIFLSTSEYFSVVSWRRDPHCLTQLTDHQFLSPASSLTFDLDTSTTSWSFFFAASSKIQNGLEWTLLMYLGWKSIQLTSQSCRISRILHCGNQLMKLSPDANVLFPTRFILDAQSIFTPVDIVKSLVVPHWRSRLEICQKIYTTQFSGEWILHTENA